MEEYRAAFEKLGIKSFIVVFDGWFFGLFHSTMKKFEIIVPEVSLLSVQDSQLPIAYSQPI